MTEKQLQAAVMRMARLRGWLAYHTYDSRRSEPGFPDLVMVRHSRLLFVELKSERGKLTEAQHGWRNALVQVYEVEVHVWRPSDWLNGSIEEALR